MLKTYLALPTIVAALLASSSARSLASIVLDLSGGTATTAFQGTAGTAGWSFTVRASITVEGLGIWDEGSNGLNSPHEVGLWNADGSVLLRSATVTNAGTVVASSSHLGEWLFAKVSPILLSQGNYFVGATYANGDPDSVRIQTGVATIAQIEYLNPQFVHTSGALTFPSVAEPSVNAGIFGPNLFIASQTSEGPVPEPLSAVVWCLGGGGALAAAVWRRRIAVLGEPNREAGASAAHHTNSTPVVAP